MYRINQCYILHQLTELKVEVVGALGGPEPQRVDDIVLIPGDGVVIRHGEHDLKTTFIQTRVTFNLQ